MSKKRPSKRKKGPLHNVTIPAKKLDRKRAAILAGLVDGESVTAISKRLKVSRMSIYRALRDPDFSEAFAEAKDQSFATARTWLSGASTRAVGELVGLLECPDPAVRRLAAVAILDRAFEAWKSAELEGRLRELERVLGLRAPGLLEGQGEDERPKS